MKESELNQMRFRLANHHYIWLTLILMGAIFSSIFVSSRTNASPLAFAGRPSGPIGTLTGCLGTTAASSSSASLTLAGRVITSSNLLGISPTDTCLGGEQSLNVFSYGSTVLISAGPDVVANGSKLLSTLNKLAALIPAPSPSQPILLKLEPGTYDLGASSLPMQSYIQIEGSGERATIISGAGQANPYSGVINAVNNTELRNLTVEGRSGNNYSIGIYVGLGVTSSFVLNHVTVQVSGGTNNVTGIYNNGGSPLIGNVSVTATNNTATGEAYGISNNAGGPQIQTSRIVVQTAGTGGKAYGIYSFGGATPFIKDSQITVTTTGSPTTSTSPDAVGISDSGADSFIQNLNLTLNTTGGATNVFGINSDSSSVTTVQNSRLSVNTSGSTTNIVIGFNVDNQANLLVEGSQLNVTTNGSDTAQGLRNNDLINRPTTATLRNTTLSVTATNKNGCKSFGFNSFGDSIAAYGVNIITTVGSGCQAAYGLVLQGGPNIITFNQGSVKSSQYAVFNSGTNPIKIGASQLDGGVSILSGSGPAQCVSSFRGDYSQTNANCS